MPQVQELVRAKTGQLAPETGIYRCTTCNEEIRVREGEHIPPCPKDANIEWELTASGAEAQKSKRPGSSMGRPRM